MSKNLRIILLAIRLQRLVKNLPAHLVSPECITKESLAKHYLNQNCSSTKENARKMAGRDLADIKEIFGLDGTDTSGYVMHKRFESFEKMFIFWFDKINPPNPNDKRMYVLLKTLIKVIGNAFRNDPISAPDLAKEMKEKFGNKNIRDSKEPLEEMFSNTTIASYLMLIEDDDGTIVINKSADPLLMRLKSRFKVGDNTDISINLALPGRIRVILDDHLNHLAPEMASITRRIATATRESHIWLDEFGNQVVPYILYREGESGPFMLTLWQEHDNNYRDIFIAEIASIPESNQARFIPYDRYMPAKLWEQFTQITA